MTFDAATDIPTIDRNLLYHEVTFNELANALSPIAGFAVDQTKTIGLAFRVLGCVLANSDGSITIIAPQTVRLTPSATNYLYATIAGAVTKTTSAPSGWPGALANGARALYQLTVGADAITSGTCYILGAGQPGGPGPTGATGPSGDEIYKTRKRVWEVTGDGSIAPAAADTLGLGAATVASGATSTRTLTAGVFSEALGRLAIGASSGGAGHSGEMHCGRNLFFRGDAAGRGGFKISIRFVLADSGFTQTNQRSFVGLVDIGNSPIANVEPDTLVNLVGVGAKQGDANLSIINNDASGTATMSSLGSNFPAKTTESTYELTLQCAANGSEIDWTVTNVGTGNSASGALTTDIPAQSQFLGWTLWINNGTSTGGTTVSLCQATSESRY